MKPFLIKTQLMDITIERKLIEFAAETVTLTVLKQPLSQPATDVWIIFHQPVLWRNNRNWESNQADQHRETPCCKLTRLTQVKTTEANTLINS